MVECRSRVSRKPQAASRKPQAASCRLQSCSSDTDEGGFVNLLQLADLVCQPRASSPKPPCLA